MQRAGDRQLVEVERHDRLRGKQRERIDPDHDRDRQILALLLDHAVVGKRVARQQEHAEAVRSAQLQAMDGDVLRSRFRVARDHEPGGDVWAAVELVVGRQRQQPGEIDVAMHHLLRRRARRFAPRQRVEQRMLEMREQAIARQRPSPPPSRLGRK